VDGLLLVQLRFLDNRRRRTHRKLGLAVLAAAPMLVATTAMLSVHSAHRGLVSGEGDFLIVQNVMGTVWLAILVGLAFLFKKRRKLHAALLLSTRRKQSSRACFSGGSNRNSSDRNFQCTRRRMAELSPHA
jgi:hypothetical protein